MSRQILLLKADESGGGGDTYQNVFSSAGFTTFFVPVLDFAFVNSDALGRALLDRGRYWALALTSPRAVEAVAKVVKEAPQVVDPWKDADVFVVGRRSAEKIERQLGWKENVIVGSGDSTALGEMIVNAKTPAKSSRSKILFPCGDLRRDGLPMTLAAANLSVEEITVYETRGRVGLEADLERVSEKQLDVVVFFSPSGVRIALPKLRDLMSDRQTRIVSIGRTTEAALIEAGMTCHGVAKSPTPDELLETVISVLSSTAE